MEALFQFRLSVHFSHMLTLILNTVNELNRWISRQHRYIKVIYIFKLDGVGVFATI